MDNLDKKIELLLRASALRLINTDNPHEDAKLKKAKMELCMCMHLEAQTCLLKEILDALQEMNGRLLTLEINSESEWDERHNR